MNSLKIFAFADEVSPRIDDQIQAMLRNKLSGLEIRNADGVNISDISDSKAKEIKKKLDCAGLSVWSVGSPIGKTNIENDDFLLQAERFKRTLELADILSAGNIRLFSFFTPAENRSEYKNAVIERLEKFCDIAHNSGVTLCHENEKGIYGDIPERCLEIHKALPEIKAVFDPANFIQCGADTCSAWKSLEPYVKYLHIKDALKNGQVVPAGSGDGNVEKIIKSFISNGGDAVTVEPHLTVFDGLSELEGSREKSLISEYSYPDSITAFNAACIALNKLL